jgi:hypothetical protein
MQIAKTAPTGVLLQKATQVFEGTPSAAQFMENPAAGAELHGALPERSPPFAQIAPPPIRESLAVHEQPF